MGIFAVWGQDAIYNGNGGMCEREVISASSKEEAEEYAITLSKSVICSYQQIYDELENQVEEICEEEEIEYGAETNEEANIRENIYNMDLEYACVELDIHKLPTLILEDLNDMFEKEEKYFIDEYQLIE